MDAMLMEQAEPPALVAEQHQILAQEPHELGRVAEFGRQQERVPEPAQILAPRRPRPDLGQPRLGRRRRPVVIAAERLRAVGHGSLLVLATVF